jgi:RNA-directed DNA polymerase
VPDCPHNGPARLISIKQVKHLARHLCLTLPEMERLRDTATSYCEELELHDPSRPDSNRIVIDIRGPLRRAQQRIYRKILSSKLSSSARSFGGVRGRHIKAHATQHLHSRFAFSCDIKNFYPTIHASRVYKFFAVNQECSPDVARFLTRFCTFRHHLALGLITSPLLAEQFLVSVDSRIGKLALDHGLVYTRYVDDITLSGSFDFQDGGIPAIIKQILKQNGFRTNDAKDKFGRISDPEFLITKLRINRGHLDVSQEYHDELCRNFRELQSLARGEDFEGPYYTRAQMWGRVTFVSWINPGRRRKLRAMYQSIPWERAKSEAKAKGIASYKKVLKPIHKS